MYMIGKLACVAWVSRYSCHGTVLYLAACCTGATVWPLSNHQETTGPSPPGRVLRFLFTLLPAGQSLGSEPVAMAECMRRD